MNDEANHRDQVRAITAQLWSQTPEAVRHGWRRVELTGGPVRVRRGLASVVVDASRLTDVNAVLLATLLDVPIGRIEAARAGVLPLVVAAAVPLDEALQVSSRIVGVPHGVVPCDPDPTWRNDGPWWEVPIAFRGGELVVRAQGAWTASLRRVWCLTVDDTLVARLPSLASEHASKVLQPILRGLGVAPEDVHPTFRHLLVTDWKAYAR